MDSTGTLPQTSATDTTVEHDLEHELTHRGLEREHALEAGGALWAEFSDWCWRTSAEATSVLFETWLVHVRPDVSLSRRTLTRALRCLAATDGS
jgi:hypothetical protein